MNRSHPVSGMRSWPRRTAVRECGARDGDTVKFDRMAIEDQKDYVGELVAGAQKVLSDAGHADQAEAVGTLFTTKPRDSDISIGMSQFESPSWRWCAAPT